MSTKTITVFGIELEVEYTYHPPYKGVRDSLNGVPGAGPPLEPDEDEYIEIERVFHKEDDIIELLSVSILNRIEDAIWNGFDSYPFGDEED